MWSSHRDIGSWRLWVVRRLLTTRGRVSFWYSSGLQLLRLWLHTSAVSYCFPSEIYNFLENCLANGSMIQVLVFVRLRRYRHEFEQILSNTSGTTTRSRFLRLYIYCSGLILFLLPTSYYTFYRHIHVERLPYSWKLIHDPEEWKIIYRIPTNGHVAFDKWIIIGAGLILFVFFGLGHDAAIMYRGWMKTVGLDKHWDRMKKRQQKHGMQQSMSSGWSGSTGMGKATNTGIMNSIASVTDRDDL